MNLNFRWYLIFGTMVIVLIAWYVVFGRIQPSGAEKDRGWHPTPTSTANVLLAVELNF